MIGHDHDHSSMMGNDSTAQNSSSMMGHHDSPSVAGTYASYNILGVFIFLLSLRNLYHYLHDRQAKCQQDNMVKRSCSRLDTVLFTIASFVSIFVEAIINPLCGRPQELSLYNIYAIFLLYLLCQLLDRKNNSIVLPQFMPECFECLAYLTGAFIFNSQASGQHLHVIITCKLLIEYLFVGVALAISLQTALEANLLAGLVRPFVGMFLGAWLCQSALIMDAPLNGAWADASHDNVMLVTVAFGWHMFGSLAFTCLCYTVMMRANKFSFLDNSQHATTSSNKQRYQLLSNISDNNFRSD